MYPADKQMCHEVQAAIGWKPLLHSISVEQGCPTFTDIGFTFTFFSLWRSTNLAKLWNKTNRECGKLDLSYLTSRIWLGKNRLLCS